MRRQYFCSLNQPASGGWFQLLVCITSPHSPNRYLYLPRLRARSALRLLVLLPLSLLFLLAVFLLLALVLALFSAFVSHRVTPFTRPFTVCLQGLIAHSFVWVVTGQHLNDTLPKSQWQLIVIDSARSLQPRRINHHVLNTLAFPRICDMHQAITRLDLGGIRVFTR
jgi:hypothetical protein